MRRKRALEKKLEERALEEKRKKAEEAAKRGAFDVEWEAKLKEAIAKAKRRVMYALNNRPETAEEKVSLRCLILD